MSNVVLGIKIKADGTAQVVGDVSKIKQAIGGTGTAAKSASRDVDNLSKALQSAKSALAGMIGVGGAFAFAKDVLDTNRSLEMLRAQLTAITGSAAGSVQAFKFIQDFAVNTPFEIDGLTKAFIGLKNYGITPTKAVMEAITNQASKLGASQETLSGIVTALGQAYGKGKLQAEEMMQLAERGVPVYDILSRAMNKSTAEIQDMAQKGELTRDVIDRLIAKMGEMASGSNAAAMDTLNGKISNLSDSWQRFEDTLLNSKGEGMIKSMVQSVTDLINIIERNLNDSVDAQIAKAEARIKTFNSMGSVGKMLADYTGYDIGIEYNKIAALSKQKQAEDDAKRLLEIKQQSASEIAKTQGWLDEVDAASAAKAEESAKKKTKAAEQAAKAASSAAETTAKAYAREREAVAQKIEQLQAEISMTGKSAEQQRIMAEVRSQTSKATAEEAAEIERLIQVKYALIDADEILADGEKLAAKQRQDAADDYARLNDKYHANLKTLKDEIADANQAFALKIIDENEFKATLDKAGQAYNDTFKKAAENASDATSKAFDRAIENIQDSLSGMFKSLLNGEALSSFTDFANKIKDVLTNALSQAMSSGLINILSGKGGSGDWMGLISGAVMIGGQMIGSLLSKSAPARSYSPAETNTQAGTGTGAMKIADMFGRDLGFAYQSATVEAFNRSARQMGSYLSEGLKMALTQTAVGKGITAAVENFMSPAIESIKNLVSGALSMIGNASTQAATSATSSLSSAIGNIGMVVGFISAGFEIAKIASSKYLSDLGKAAESLLAISPALLAIPVVGWIASAVTHAMGTWLNIFDTGFTAKNLGNLLFGPVGGFLGGLFGDEPAPPNFKWYQTGGGSNPESYDANAGASYYKTGGGSKGMKIQTPFGELKMQIFVDGGGVKGNDVISAFSPLLKVVKDTDNGLVKALDAIDERAMAFYRDNTGSSIWKGKQSLKGMDVASALMSRYGAISDVLGKSDTAVGEAFDAWFDVLTSKFIKASKNNVTQILGIVSSVAVSLKSFMTLPLSLTKVIADSVKSVSQGATPDQVAAEIEGIVSAFAVAKTGLKNLGASVNDERVVTFLANVNAIGYGVKDAGANLVAYAGALKLMNKNIGDLGEQLMITVETKMRDMKAKGLDNAAMTAYFGSFGLMAKLFAEVKVSFTEADLDAVALHLHDLGRAASATAKAVVDQAIADNKLTKISRDNAIAQLLRAGKLDEATVAEAEYGVSITKTTQELLSAMSFMQQLGYVGGKSLGDMGMAANTWVAAAKNVVNVFGDMQTAMQTLDSIAKTFLSPQDYAQYNLDTVNRSLDSIATNNPLFKGLTEKTIAESIKSGSLSRYIINLMAEGDGATAKTMVQYIQLLQQRIAAETELNNAMAASNEAYRNEVRATINAIRQAEAEAERLAAEKSAALSQQAADRKAGIFANGSPGEFTKIVADVLRMPEFKSYIGADGFNAGKFNQALARAQYDAQKQVYSDVSEKALSILDVGSVLAELSKIPNELVKSVRNSISDQFRGTDTTRQGGSKLSSFIDGLTERNVGERYRFYGDGIGNLLSEYGNYIASRGNKKLLDQANKSLAELDRELARGTINAAQYAKTQGELNAEIKRLTGGGSGNAVALAAEGVRSINYYFRQMADAVKELDAAAAEVNDTLNQTNGAIGRLKSLAFVMQQSAAAASYSTNFGDLALSSQARLIAQSASIAARMVTTADSARVARKLSDQFTNKRDAALLIDGIREYDAKTFENAFLRINNALAKGDINQYQYKELFGLAFDAFTGFGQSVDEFKSAAKSLADELLVDKNTTFLNPVQRMNEALRQYVEDLTNAGAGDLGALNELGSSSRTYLDAVKDNAATLVDFNRESAKVIGDIRRLENNAATLDDVVAENKKLRDEISALRAEMQAGQVTLAKNTRTTATILDRWDVNGMPATVV